MDYDCDLVLQKKWSWNNLRNCDVKKKQILQGYGKL